LHVGLIWRSPKIRLIARTPSKNKYWTGRATYLKRENLVLNHEWRTKGKSKYQDVEHTYLKRENSAVNHKENSKAQLCTCKLKTNFL
jgi:hypothetical protein